MARRTQRLLGWARGAAAWDILKWVVGAVIGSATTIWGLLKEWGPVAVVLGLAAFGLVLFIVNEWTRRQEIRGVAPSMEGQMPRQAKPGASASELASNYISGRTVRLTDLVPDLPAAPVIRGKTFENCDILGPAVVVSKMSSLYESTFIFGEKERDVFIETPSNDELHGVIGLERCVFRECIFLRVGFIAPKDQIDAFLAEAGKGRDKGSAGD